MMRENGDGSIIENPEWDSKITFTVRDPEQTDWIRMEKIPRAEMEKTEFAPGTGIRDYFTTDLVTNTLKDATSITIDGESDGSRSRIYFYIDENVPTSNNTTNYGERKAIIDVHYERSDNGVVVDQRDRTLEIEQRALVKVSVTSDNHTAWMEYYEEYLEHNDPLDPHTAPGEYYTGLPWGESGVDYLDFTSVNINNYIQGYQMTKDIVENNNTASLSTVKLYNHNTPPQSAFHYCYGKNKRTNTIGTTALTSIAGRTVGWYMPGIRELEYALRQYYTEFEDFRGNFYWSAASAKRRNFGERELNTHARATKIISVPPPGSNEQPQYAQSGSTDNTDNYTGPNGTKGRTPRGTSLRIRAFYRAQ